MINKLKRRIFWIIQIPLSLIVIGMIILFTSYTYKDIIASSVMFIDRIDGREEFKEECINAIAYYFENEMLGLEINYNDIVSDTAAAYEIWEG